MLPLCDADSLDLFVPDSSLAGNAGRWGCSPLTAAVTMAAGLSEPPLPQGLGALIRGLDLGSAQRAMTELWRRVVPGASVLVYGDYDVDGVSSASLALHLLRASGAARQSWYIPHRADEGYGFHPSVVAKARAAGFQVMVVTDCGTKDLEAVEAARQAGMTVLVFDHHLTEGDRARPDALLNPQIDGDAQAKTLCATAVVWCWALQSGLFGLNLLDHLVQLAALATVSDCMPLAPLNKALIRRGLEVTNRRPLPGLAKIYEAFGLKANEVTEEDWAMKVVPCLNAPGRLSYADASVQVLTAIGDLEAAVARVVEINRRRRDLAGQISASLTSRFGDGGPQVFYDGSWPVGLLSAVASRLCSNSGLAVALAGKSGKSVRGTLRVPEGANAVELLKDLAPHLEKWGGHPFAAGFSVNPAKWPLVSSELDRVLRALDVPPRRERAIAFDPAGLTKRDLDDLARLGPFGKGNPKPLLYTPCRGDVVLPLGKTGRHCRIVAAGAELVAFDGFQQLDDLSHVTGWLYSPRINTWQGVSRAQFVVEKIVTRGEVSA